MHDGYISIWLVGCKERCDYIPFSFDNVSEVPTYEDTVPLTFIRDLGVWAISAFQYGSATFQEFRIPERFVIGLMAIRDITELT